MLREKLHLKRGATWLQAVAMSLILRAVTGDQAACEEIVNRLEGKPVAPVELGRDRGPLDIIVRYEKTPFKE